MRSRSAVLIRTLVVTVAVAAVASACRGAATAADAAKSIANETASDAAYSVYELPTVWRNQRGDTLHLTALAGRVRLIAMVYTNCHTTCPLTISDLKRIEAAIPADRRNDVGFVLVSLDALRDTPEQLTKWANGLGLDSERWTLLSGSADAVRELAVTLDVRYQPQQNGEVAHSNALTVLDRRGNVVHQQLTLGETAESIRIINGLLQ